MEMRVEQLSVGAGVSVDTIRYYQSKGLLEPPRRQGRVAWYDEGHLERLARIRSLQQRGFTLATIVRLVTGDLDAADEALVGELSGAQRVGAARQSPGLDNPLPSDPGPGDDRLTITDGGRAFTLAELADETGVPLALLKAVEAEGLLIPRRVTGRQRYTEDDVAAAQAGLLLLEWGIPLSALLELARRHHEATEAVAREAVAMFSAHVRGPLRDGLPVGPEDRSASETAGGPDVDRLLQAYSELLPAVDALVGHHFTRTLVKVALDHVEQVGSEDERRAVWGQVEGDTAAALGNGQEAAAPIP